MKAKEILVLILIILTGVLIHHIHTGKIDMDWAWDEGFFFQENEFIFEESQEIAHPYPSAFHIINSHGSIEILGTQEQNITIHLEKKIWRKDAEKASEIAEQLRLQTDTSNDRIVVTTNREDFRRKNFRTNFKIEVPEDMDVEVKNGYGQVDVRIVRNANVFNSHGRVEAAGINGTLVIKNSHNDVNATGVQADCQIESSYSTIRAGEIKGKTEISHKFGKVHLEEIGMKVTIDGDHTEVRAQNISGPIEIESSYRKISLKDIGTAKILTKNSVVDIEKAKGDLNIVNDHGRIRLTDILGSLDISGESVALSGEKITGSTIAVSSSYRDIELSDFSADTRIDVDHGLVILKPLPLLYPLEVKGKYTDIRFHWPPGGEYPLEAKVKGGDIQWEVPFSPTHKDENSTTVIRAFDTIMNQPRILLTTEYATILITQ